MKKQKKQQDRGITGQDLNQEETGPETAKPYTGLNKPLLFLSAAVLVFLLYSQILHAPFVFDDLQNIEQNKHIRITSLVDMGQLMDAGTKSLCSTRPVANISFAVNYYFHQYDLVGYHVVNILVHLLTGLFLFLLIKATLTLSKDNSSSPLADAVTNPSLVAFAAVVLWLVHPIQTQSVTYIVQRMNSMAAMFFVLSMLLYVKGRMSAEGSAKWAWFGGSVLSGALAIGSKEIAITLPVFIALYEWYFFQGLNVQWLKRHAIGLAIGAVGLAVFVVAFLASFDIDPLGFIQVTYKDRTFTMGQRLLTELRVLVLYIGLLVLPLPSRLNLDYEYPVSLSLINPATTLLSLAVVLGLLGLSVYFAKRDKLVSFTILWFFGTLAVESTFLGLELVYEHRTYLPSMFVILAAVLAGNRYIRPQWAKVLALCLVVVVFSLWTFQRNTVWKEKLTLWQDCVSKAPDNARALNNLGLSLFELNRLDEAIEKIARSFELNPSRPDVASNLGNAYLAKKMYPEAHEYFSRAMSISPEYLGAYEGMGLVMDRTGHFDQAARFFTTILEKDPDNEKAHNYLGKVLARQGSMNEAIEHLNEAIRLNPSYYEPYNNMGNALLMQGKAVEAAGYYSRAIELDPKFADAFNNLGTALLQQGRTDEAIVQISKALEKEYRYDKAHINMAIALIRKNEFERALIHAEEAVKINPANQASYEGVLVKIARKKQADAAMAQVLDALKRDPGNAALLTQAGDLYKISGDTAAAEQYYGKALSADPGSLKALYGLAVLSSMKGEYGKTLTYLNDIVRIDPKRPDTYYNIACVHAKQGRVDEAVQWLGKSIEKGFKDWDLLDKDQDLSSVRNTAFYKELVERRSQN